MNLGTCLECRSTSLSLKAASEAEECIRRHIKKLTLSYKKHGFSAYPISLGDVDKVVLCNECNSIRDLIEHYKNEYRLKEQVRVVDGVPVNPKQRYYFDSLNNGLRPTLEKNDWFGVPYIVSCSVIDNHKSKTYKKRVNYLKSVGMENNLPTR